MTALSPVTAVVGRAGHHAMAVVLVEDRVTRDVPRDDVDLGHPPVAAERAEPLLHLPAPVGPREAPGARSRGPGEVDLVGDQVEELVPTSFGETAAEPGVGQVGDGGRPRVRARVGRAKVLVREAS